MIKKRTLISIIAVVAGLSLLSGCHHRWDHHDRTKWILDRVDDYVEDYTLTEQQNQSYQDIRLRLEEDLEKMYNDHQAFKDSLEAKVNTENVQLPEITAMLKEKGC